MIPRVYSAISAVTAAFARNGIAKERFNLADDYAYRSIDDVLIRLAPLLAEHKLCVLPRVLARELTERTGTAGELLVSVAVRVAYDLVSAEDGSVHTIEAHGEALDGSDKATAKAMQSAYKYAVIQAFAIPVTGTEDADARSPRLKAPEVPAEPVQGWEQWCADVSTMIAACESGEAITRVQQTYRPQLAGLQRERAELYAQLGQVIGRRGAELRSGGAASQAEQQDVRQNAAERSGTEPSDLPQNAAEHGGRRPSARCSGARTSSKPKRARAARGRAGQPEEAAALPASAPAAGVLADA